MITATIARRLVAAMILLGSSTAVALGGEPDPKFYWNVDDVRPGMKGKGQTVMVGTRLEEFGAEVLGVMKGVSPGRDSRSSASWRPTSAPGSPAGSGRSPT